MTNLYEASIDRGGITISAVAEKSESKAKSKATDKSVRPTHVSSTQASSTQALTARQLGEIAEAELIAKAVGMGLVVAKPWGIASFMILL